ncbi:MAG: ABC transporter ATP-binding protein, partial [Firmicutes bacterium]|nr:ABC transporter ATP-binding protein [Bacillota bacterium]
MLKLENISKYYYSNDIIALGLRKVDLEFQIGEFVAITGESGSGKSTLLNVLSGLDTYELGKMYINDEDISHYTVKELEEYRRQYVGFVFQNYNIVDSYTVLQNVEMALTVQGYDKKNRRGRALELIDKVGLSSRVHHKASRLSGGEKQRTVIARALAKDCKIMVCDEPTGNLDTESTKLIFELLHQISKEKLVIVVTHNYPAISPYATRKIRLFDGEVVEDKKINITSTIRPEKIAKKANKINYFDVLRIAFNNIISVPKKTAFSIFVTVFIISTFVFSYGSNLKQRNTSTVYETPYFSNSNPSRIVITKYDKTAFTEEEIANLRDVEYVRDVILYDVVLDTILTSKFYNDVFDFDEFIDYKVMSV